MERRERQGELVADHNVVGSPDEEQPRGETTKAAPRARPFWFAASPAQPAFAAASTCLAEFFAFLVSSKFLAALIT